MYIDFKYIYYRNNFLIYVDPETYLVYVIYIKLSIWTTMSLANLHKTDSDMFLNGLIWNYINPYTIETPIVKNGKIYAESIETFLYTVIIICNMSKMMNMFITDQSVAGLAKEYLQMPEDQRNKPETINKLQNLIINKMCN